jgi:hypothetical protein
MPHEEFTVTHQGYPCSSPARRRGDEQNDHRATDGLAQVAARSRLCLPVWTSSW